MDYTIPLFNLNFDEEEEKNVVNVLKSRWISSGPRCEELENIFAEMLDAKYAVAVSSCTAALHLAVLCAGIRQGDEVILPSLTFVATANAVRYAGGIPVFCEITSKSNLTVDVNEVEKLVTPKTRAIIVMHYAGFACDMDSINLIAQKYNLRVIEDACHGPLSQYGSSKLGTLGDVGCFSFFSNKNISTGEGGMLVTNNKSFYEKARLLRSHGMTTMSYERAKGHSTQYDVIDLGYNYRLDDIRAAIGIAQMKKLKPDIEKRNTLRQMYIKNLKTEEKLIIPFEDYNYISASYIFPVVLKNGDSQKRDFIRNYLAAKGIQTSVHYPPVHRFKIYQEYVTGPLEKTEYVSDCEFTLPMYGALTEKQILYICSVLHEALENII